MTPRIGIGRGPARERARTRAWRRRATALAVPIMLANVGTSLSGVADTAVMGRMDSPLHLSATAIGATLFSTLYWAFGFLRMGTGGLVAQAFGARDAEEQRRVAVRAIALGAAIGAVVVLLSDPLLALGLSAMAGGEALHALTGDYFRVRVLSAPATLALFAIHGVLIGRQAMGSVLRLELVGFPAQALDGFAHAAEALTGEAVGRKDPRRLSSAVRAATSLAAFVAVGLALLWALAGGALIDLMTTQPKVREAARVWLPWAVAVPLVGVWSFLLDGIFTGATRTREMRDTVLLSLALFVAATFALVPPFGNHGLWLAYLVLLAVRALALGRHWPHIRAAATPGALAR